MRGDAMKNNAGETLGIKSEYFFGTDTSREASAEADNTDSDFYSSKVCES